MNIGNTTCVLTEDTTKTVQSLVMSRLDYCNAFPIGIQRDLIAKLQRLQNSAARIVSWGKWEVVNITCAFEHVYMDFWAQYQMTILSLLL